MLVLTCCFWPVAVAVLRFFLGVFQRCQEQLQKSQEDLTVQLAARKTAEAEARTATELLHSNGIQLPTEQDRKWLEPYKKDLKDLFVSCPLPFLSPFNSFHLCYLSSLYHSNFKLRLLSRRRRRESELCFQWNESQRPCKGCIAGSIHGILADTASKKKHCWDQRDGKCQFLPAKSLLQSMHLWRA